MSEKLISTETPSIVNYISLEMPKTRRQDKRTERYWENNPPTNSWKEYQKEWNFIETEYDAETLMSNGLDMGNPGFAWKTKYVKYLRHKKAEIKDGKIIKTWYV